MNIKTFCSYLEQLIRAESYVVRLPPYYSSDDHIISGIYISVNYSGISIAVTLQSPNNSTMLRGHMLQKSLQLLQSCDDSSLDVTFHEGMTGIIFHDVDFLTIEDSKSKVS